MDSSARPILPWATRNLPHDYELTPAMIYTVNFGFQSRALASTVFQRNVDRDFRVRFHPVSTRITKSIR